MPRNSHLKAREIGTVARSKPDNLIITIVGREREKISKAIGVCLELYGSTRQCDGTCADFREL